MNNIVIVRCSACGHEERGAQEKSLMQKIRMWNHVNRSHPYMLNRFREMTEQYSIRVGERMQHA